MPIFQERSPGLRRVKHTACGRPAPKGQLVCALAQPPDLLRVW